MPRAKRHEWLKVAKYDSKGPFSGRVIPFRGVKGPHQWKVTISCKREILEDGEEKTVIDSNDVLTSAPIELAALAPQVFGSIAELQPSILDLGVQIDFYIKGR